MVEIWAFEKVLTNLSLYSILATIGSISLTFTVTVIQLQLSQMDLYVLHSTNQIEVTTLQEPFRSQGLLLHSQVPWDY